MIPGIWNIIAPKGATFNETITLRDSAGALINLTGYTARMPITDSYADSVALLVPSTSNSGIVLGGAAGTVRLIISATDMDTLSVAAAAGAPPTALYYYMLELITGSTVLRYLEGKFTVTNRLPRAVS